MWKSRENLSYISKLPCNKATDQEHEDVLTLECFPLYWPFVRESTSHWWIPFIKAQQCGALMAIVQHIHQSVKCSHQALDSVLQVSIFILVNEKFEMRCHSWQIKTWTRQLPICRHFRMYFFVWISINISLKSVLLGLIYIVSGYGLVTWRWQVITWTNSTIDGQGQWWHIVSQSLSQLTHLTRFPQMTNILRTTFWIIFFNENLWILIKISLKFVPKGPINNCQELVRWWLVTNQATSHYLNQWWLDYWCIYIWSLGLSELKQLLSDIYVHRYIFFMLYFKMCA